MTSRYTNTTLYNLNNQRQKYAYPDTRIVGNQTLQDETPERYWYLANDECWANLKTIKCTEMHIRSHLRHRNSKVKSGHAHNRLLEHETRHVCFTRVNTTQNAREGAVVLQIFLTWLLPYSRVEQFKISVNVAFAATLSITNSSEMRRSRLRSNSFYYF